MKAKKVALPDFCFAALPSTGQPIVIDRGTSGYTGLSGTYDIDAENKKLGVTAGQRDAMFTGSMFGWKTPGADPENYDDAGTYLPPADRSPRPGGAK